MDDFQQNGYQILSNVIALESIELFKEKIAEYTKDKTAYGIRDLYLQIPASKN